MIDWVIGIGDVESKQWMADIFWGGNWQPEINMPQL
jgi:hypothetical protein